MPTFSEFYALAECAEALVLMFSMLPPAMQMDAVLMVLDILQLMGRTNREGERGRLLVSELVPPEVTPIASLLQRGGDRSFMYMFHINIATFTEIVHIFDELMPNRKASRDFVRAPAGAGRPPRLNNWMLVALGLVFLTSPIPTKALQLMFCVGLTTLRKDLHAALDGFDTAFMRIADAAVPWPSLEQQMAYNAILRSRFPHRYPWDSALVPFGLVDGTHLRVPAPGSVRVGDHYYSGYKRQYTENNIFVFSPTGLIIHAVTNMPGRTADVSGTVELVRRLADRSLTVEHGVLLADNGFSGRAGIVTTKAVGKGPAKEDAAALSAYATFVRQSNEWGNATFKAMIGRVLALPASKEARLQVLRLGCRLYNLATTRSAGHNEMQTVYAHCVARSLERLASTKSSVRELIDDAVRARNAHVWAAHQLEDDEDYAVDVPGLPAHIRSSHEAVVELMLNERYTDLVTGLLDDAAAMEEAPLPELSHEAMGELYAQGAAHGEELDDDVGDLDALA